MNKTGWAIYYYVVIIGSIVMLWNEWGGQLIQRWYGEYVYLTGELNGSGKWRTRKGFFFFTWLFGLWVYPLSDVSFIFLIVQYVKKRLCLREFAYYILFPVLILFFYVLLGVDYAMTRGGTWYEFLPKQLMFFGIVIVEFFTPG